MPQATLRIPIYLFRRFPEKGLVGIVDEYIVFSHNVTNHTMKCLFETNNESGHRFLTMS